MVLRAFVGITLALVVNLPAILYVYWSRRVLREYSGVVAHHGFSSWPLEVWLRLVLWAGLVSIVWLIWANALSILTYFLTYFRQGEELAFAQVVQGICFIPITISSWIADLLTEMRVPLEGTFLHPILSTALLSVILLATSIFESRFFKRTKRVFDAPSA
jgi:hypothetical protein